jgi:hypothetical protein
VSLTAKITKFLIFLQAKRASHHNDWVSLEDYPHNSRKEKRISSSFNRIVSYSRMRRK